MTTNPLIDAVITWVDGSDPSFIANKNKYAALELSEKPDIISMGLLDTRFNNIGEVVYCIKLIRKNIEWAGRIFLVTNGQVPVFLTDAFKNKYNIVLITHEQIFTNYEYFLPVFNSQSIEAMLCNIPGLSEDFLYFNDDFFVIQKIGLEEFKLGQKYMVRGLRRFKNIWLDRVHRFLRIAYVPGTVGKRFESDSYPEKFMYFSPMHAPYVLNKTIMRQSIEASGGFGAIVKYKFRGKNQPWPIGLFINELAKRGLLYQKKPHDTGYYHGYTHGKFDFFDITGLKFFSAQSLDSLPLAEQKKAIGFLNDLVEG